MQPIPRAMLPHAATLATAEADAYGALTLTPVAELTRVRVETFAEETLTGENAHVRHSALLLYDVRNSRPANVTFAPGQCVLYAGRAYRVESVEPLYDGRRLHHTEVALVG